MADTLKEEAAPVVAELHGLGLQVAMITGDNVRTAEAIAAHVGIDRVLTEPPRTRSARCPIIAGAAMAFSSVSVVTNTLRLQRFGKK